MNNRNKRAQLIFIVFVGIFLLTALIATGFKLSDTYRTVLLGMCGMETFVFIIALYRIERNKTNEF